MKSEYENQFVEHFFPMAKRLANRVAGKFRGNPYAKMIDADSCLSYALEGVLQIARARPNHELLDELDGLVAIAITRRIAELQREVIGAKGHTRRDPMPLSLDEERGGTGNNEGTTTLKDTLIANESDSQHESELQYSREHAKAKAKIKAMLGEIEYKVLCAAIDHPDHMAKEIAKMLDMRLNNYETTLLHVRKKMNNYPDFKAELSELLLDNRSKSQHTGSGRS